jgi:glyoxylase-like metal-dependent hydrolase (beta-lactamase superfamily II)
MALTTEVADQIYEIQPEGNTLDRFPLCTVYLIVDDKLALVEAGCAIQTPEIIEAIEVLVDDVNKLSYVLLTHPHPDHVGGVGHLAQRLPNVQFIAYPGVGKLLSDPSVIAKMMSGFKRSFGENAEERFGVMLPVEEERFLSIENGQSIALGNRELRAMHTPGHDPYHLCFYDTRSKGLFCGDVMGGYVAEIDSVFPPLFPGTDFLLVLKSMEKIREINPAKLFFSHGCTIGDAEKNIKTTKENIKKGQDIAQKGLLAREDREKIAYRLIDAYPKFSELVKSQMSNPNHIQRGLRWVDAYSWYLKKMNMI